MFFRRRKAFLNRDLARAEKGVDSEGYLSNSTEGRRFKSHIAYH